MPTTLLHPFNEALWDCYQKGYESAVKKQQTKHGGGPNYGTYATHELTDEIVILVDKEVITRTEAKRLARTLGKMEYGEIGLSGARAEIPLRKMLGKKYDWLLVRDLKSKCPQR